MTENNEVEMFGPYHLLSKLGEGGMGVVHVAEHIGEAGFRKRVAIKRMHQHYQGDHRLLEYFAAEARTNARIDHPNVVHVLEFGLEPEPYIVMEYVDGVSLRALLWRFHEQRWSMDLRAATLIAAEASLGLDVAHRMTDSDSIPLGIVHRDISPSNVLISNEGSVKVSDFGLVMVADNPFSTTSERPIGKPHYMAPEQAECRPLEARADVFALGLVLWESLTQRQLLPRDDPSAIRQMLATCYFHPPSRFNPHVPAELDWITMGCLKKEPRDRWASAEALSLALRQVIHTRSRGYDRIQLANLVRNAFPERGWGPKQPALPPPQPTMSQVARMPASQKKEEAPPVEPPVPPSEQTTPGEPHALLLAEREAVEVTEGGHEPPLVFGLSARGRRLDAGSDQYLVAQLERSMWILQSSRPLQDGARIRGPSQGQLMIVFGGAGGRNIGEFGGVLAVDTLAHYAFSVMPWTVPKSKTDARMQGRGLLSAARACAAQLRIIAETEGLDELGGVSLTAAYVLWPDLFVVHVGDSHCYSLREGKLHRITRTRKGTEESKDDALPTLGRVLIDAKSTDEGSTPVDLHYVELAEGDTLMLCTNGLPTRVPEPRLEEMLRHLDVGDDVESCVRTLVDATNPSRSEDVTVVLARF